MRLDDLPDQFQAFIERAEAVLQMEVAKAKKTVAALTTEKAAVEKGLAELQDQQASTKKQLDATLANLDRATTLAKLDHEITEGRKTLDKLKVDTAKATTALEAVEKQRKEAEQQLSEANDALRGLRQERTDATAEIDKVRKLVKSFA
jgi:chromosome segregation ATPase